MKGTDHEIDRLYQLPLDAFTAERNASAKRAGAGAARIRGLAKPSVPAWAVNQLYWEDRGAWDALVAAADNLRRAHKAVLGGRSGDIRAAGKVHDEAVDAAVEATLAILRRSSHPITDATRQAVINTLRALPSADAQPGRLTTALQPGGFEMLAGLTITGATRAAVARRAASPPASRAHQDSSSKADARAITAARQEAASSERALKEAEQAVRREEFESARAAREERRAADVVEKARGALDEARRELERAETAHRKARGEREHAEKRIPGAREAVTTARSRAQAAAAALKKLMPSR